MSGKRRANSPAAAAPPPAYPSLCCMCGDPGIEEELFKCRNCSTRLQHKYCSNLYPKVDQYLACNWCLGEEGLKLPEPGEHSTSCSSTGGGFVGVNLRRGAFASVADEQPIKKPRLLPPGRRTTSSPDEAERSGSKTLRTGLGRAKPAVCRIRVRRYKLLEEIYSPAKLLDLHAAALYT